MELDFLNFNQFFLSGRFQNSFRTLIYCIWKSQSLQWIVIWGFSKFFSSKFVYVANLPNLPNLIGGLLGHVYQSDPFKCEKMLNMSNDLYSSNGWTLMFQEPVCRQICKAQPKRTSENIHWFHEVRKNTLQFSRKSFALWHISLKVSSTLAQFFARKGKIAYHT